MKQGKNRLAASKKYRRPIGRVQSATLHILKEYQEVRGKRAGTSEKCGEQCLSTSFVRN
jgi:hypothetical protein